MSVAPRPYTEDAAVEKPAIELFGELGWDHLLDARLPGDSGYALSATGGRPVVGGRAAGSSLSTSARIR